MSKQDAEAIIGLIWRGERQSDPRLSEALCVLGISPTTFSRLRGEMRRTERKFSSLLILTPAGHGRRV